MKKSIFSSDLHRKASRLRIFLARVKKQIISSCKAEPHFIKNSSGLLIPNKKRYSAWTRKLYNDLGPNRRFISAKSSLKKALAMQKTHQPPNHTKQLFLDISLFIKSDRKTGVQRVVRNILSEFLLQPPHGYHIEPVYGSEGGIYRYARSDEPIDTFKGDIFLGLDLIPPLIRRYKKTYQHFKANGTLLYFIVYDLIPIRYPHFFSKRLKYSFSCWLKQIMTQADGVICISRSVMNELNEWLQKNPLDSNPSIGWFHLGANIDLIQPNTEKSHTINFDAIKQFPSVLMVSTIEPHKGYEAALAAFENLWEQGQPINLVIVGKQGTKVENLVKALKKHPLKNKHLFWFPQIDDTSLLALYETCQGLLMASVCEGFGLALIEAAYHKLPILARDIPIFREVASQHAAYFTQDNPEMLGQEILTWLDNIKQGKAPLSEKIPYLNWTQSYQQLINILIADK